MGFAPNFSAIDFETASRRTDSACQLAVVVVREGEIVDQKMWMIRPEPFYFSPTNIRIHGIRPQRVQDEPSFGEHWNDISPYLLDECLVAHNAAFDMGVLIGCLGRHRIACPELQFTCTRLIARRVWPGRRRYGLKPLSEWLGVRFRHHDALEDSIACAKLLLAAGIDKKAGDLADLEKRLRIARGRAGPWGISHPGRRKSPANSKPAFSAKRGGRSNSAGQPAVHESSAEYWITNDPDHPDTPVPTTPSPVVDWQRLAIRGEFIQPLRGQSVVFTGKLVSMTREQAVNLTQRCGGKTQFEVDEETSCLVIGESANEQSTVESIEADARQPDEERKARELCSRGQEIQILSEQEFLELFSATTQVPK